MPPKTKKRKVKNKNTVRITLAVIAGLFLAVFVFFGISYGLYYSGQAADLPCRNCSGDARSVHVGGFDLYYREVGTSTLNPPFVLVHGGPGMSSLTFKKSFDFLATNFRVIYYDQRGSGNSQIKPDPAYYTIDQLVEELEALRRDVIKADKIIPVGHSAGGAVVQRYVIAYPQHVADFILIDSIPANGGMTVSGFFPDVLLAGMNVLAGNFPSASPRQTDAKFQELSYRSSLQRLYDPTNATLLQDTGYVSFVTYREISRSTFGGNYADQLRKLQMPSLLIYGAADSPGTGKAGMTRLHELLQNSTLEVFDHSGHWPFLEEPSRFQSVLWQILGFD